MATPDATAKELKPGRLLGALPVLGIGAIIALYLVNLKLNLLYSPDFDAGCNFGGGFDCDKVNSSEFSTILGLPISLFAVPTYLMMAYLAWRGVRAADPANLDNAENARSGLAAAGTIGLLTCLYSLYLFYVSVAVVEAKCIWCIGLYVVNFSATALLVTGSGLGLVGTVRTGVSALVGIQGPLLNGLGVFIIAGGVTWGWYDQANLSGAAVKEARGMAAVDAAYAIPSNSTPQTAGINVAATSTAPAATVKPNAAVPATAAPAQPAATVVPNAKPAAVKNIDPNTARAHGQKTKDGWTNFDIPLDPPNEFWAGNPNATVTVVKFADFQCAYCKFLASSIKPLKKEFGDKVRFVMRHFPMNGKCNPPMRDYDKHPYACEAAYASHCAGMQGKFWAMHDKLYENQNDLEPENLRAYASEVGLDVTEFDRCYKADTTVQAIKQDIDVAYKAGIHGTPRTYINGRLVMGSASTNVLKYHLKRAMEAPAQAAANPTALAATPKPGAPVTAPKAAPVPDGRAMIAVPNGPGKSFFIDPYEQVVTKKGKARSAPGNAPSQVSWFDAKAACEAGGKRLCTEQEWVTACAGQPAVDNNNNKWFSDDDLEGNMYPYGAYHAAGKCNDQGDKYKGRPVASGSKPQCRTTSGIFDLTGNIGEWVNGEESRATLMGGQSSSGEGARCNARSYGSGVGRRNHTTGFRCCADANVTHPNKVTANDIQRAPGSLMGQPVPAVEATDTQGKPIDTGKFKGKVTLVNFFASWCGPCKKEFPFLVGFQKKFAAKGFQIVAFGTDSAEKRSWEFAQKYDPNFSVVADTKSKASGVFGVHSMPATFIIDRSGVIRYMHTGFKPEEDAAPMERAIEKLL